MAQHGLPPRRRHLRQGQNEILVSGYSWHTPWTWTAEKRAEENEHAWGGGWARSTERENGDTDTVYFLVFSDSHYEPEYNLGYGWTTWWRPRDSLQPGSAYTLMLVSRQDIWGGAPFPALLPLVALRYDRLHGALDVHPELKRRHQQRQRAVRLREDHARLKA